MHWAQQGRQIQNDPKDRAWFVSSNISLCNGVCRVKQQQVAAQVLSFTLTLLKVMAALSLPFRLVSSGSGGAWKGLIPHLLSFFSEEFMSNTVPDSDFYAES